MKAGVGPPYRPPIPPFRPTDATPLPPPGAEATPPTPGLSLPALHASLLPLARAAGHEQLLLTCHYDGTADSACYYEADATGGSSGFRRYISWLDKDGGDRPEHFERILRTKLEQQASLRQAGQPGSPA